MNSRRKFLQTSLLGGVITGSSDFWSRIALQFDKPEKDNATRKEPYPALSASPQTIGHTGYTGTCVWIDPVYHLTFIFLSNRVNPEGGNNNKLSQMNIRPKIMEAIYKAMVR